MTEQKHGPIQVVLLIDMSAKRVDFTLSVVQAVISFAVASITRIDYRVLSNIYLIGPFVSHPCLNLLTSIS